MKNATAKHPRQPMVIDEHGTVRFKRNAICRFLIDDAPKDRDMNAIADLVRKGAISNEDYVQFCQLIGYSVSGFGDLSMVPAEEVEECDALAYELLEKNKATTL